MLGAALLVALVGIVNVHASAAGATNLKQQAEQLQAQWLAQHGHEHAAKIQLAPGTHASCPINLDQAPVVGKVDAQSLRHGQKQEYNSFIHVISAEKRFYTVLGEVNQIVVEQRRVDMCDPNDIPPAPRAFAIAQQVGQITLTGVHGDVVTFTTANNTSGQFNYVSGQYLSA